MSGREVEVGSSVWQEEEERGPPAPHLGCAFWPIRRDTSTSPRACAQSGSSEASGGGEAQRTLSNTLRAAKCEKWASVCSSPCLLRRRRFRAFSRAASLLPETEQ